MRRGVIIQGSSNSLGETYKITSLVSEKMGYPIVDLKSKRIGQFDYEFRNKNDDFHPLRKHIVDSYDILILATPVYWYTMSGIMKKFLDRFSDCLEKETGHKLKGKEMAVISSGEDEILKDGFHMPFIETSRYLGMKYITDIHSWHSNGEIPEKVKIRLEDFIRKIS